MKTPNLNLSNINILLVDNDPTSLEKIKSSLEQDNDNFNIKIVSSGEEAIKKLSKNSDIIVSEYQIPDMSGLDLLKKAKDSHNIPFIFFTREKRKKFAKKAFNNGADRYIHREDDLDTELEILSNSIIKEVHHDRIEKIKQQRRNELIRLTNNIPGLAYRCLNDENWTMKFLSDGVKDLTGYESNDLINNKNLSYSDIIHPEDRERVQKEIEKALDKGKQFRVSYRIQTAEDKIKWVWEQGSKVDLEGETKLEGIIIDISERKIMEERLRHINTLLKSIRDINQLITKADDLDYLLNRATEILNKSEGYLNTSISLIDNNKLNLHSNSGLHSDRDWKFNLNSENIPKIFKKAMKNKKPIKNLETEEYTNNSFLSGETHPMVIVPMIYDEEVAGILSICFSKDRNIDEEDLKLLEEISGDLAYAMDKIKTDKKLKESEIRFRSFFDRSPNALVIVNSEDIIINLNTRFEEVFGYKAEEIKGKNINNVLVPDKLLDEAYELKKKGQEGFYRFETVREGKKSEIPVSISAIPVNINEEKYIIASYEDISDRKQVEKELKDSRNRYKSLFENSPVVIWEEDYSEVKSYLEKLKKEVDSLEKYLQNNPSEVKKLAGKVRVIDVNKTALDYYGCKSKEKIINNREEMFTNDAYEAFKEELLKIADGKTDIKSESTAQTFDSEKKHELLELSIPEKYSDTYERAYLSIVDITKRKKMEKELKERERRLNNAIDKSPYPMMILDEEGEVLRINEAWEDISGYSHDDIPTIYDWISKAYDEDDEMVKREIEELFERFEKVDEGEFTIKTKRGEERIWYFSSAPLGSLPNGKKLIISMAKDITDRKNAERERKFINSMLRQDIQTKAQLATGYLQLLRDCELSDQCSKYVKKGLESGLEQIDLINRVQKLRETEVEEPYQMDLDQEIKEIIKEQRDEIKKIETEKTIRYKQNHESYVLATSLLKELIINLIKLGIEDKKCEEIAIQTEERGEEVLIKIKTDTRTILPETKEKILKSGYSGDTTGFGGLRFYMIKRIINMLDTETEIETTPENQTQFTVHLEKSNKKEKND